MKFALSVLLASILGSMNAYAATETVDCQADVLELAQTNLQQAASKLGATAVIASSADIIAHSVVDLGFGVTEKHTTYSLGASIRDAGYNIKVTVLEDDCSVRSVVIAQVLTD